LAELGVAVFCGRRGNRWSVGMHRHRWAIAAVAVLCFAIAWCAVAISGRVVFPSSLRLYWLLPLCVSAGGFACFSWLVTGERRRHSPRHRSAEGGRQSGTAQERIAIVSGFALSTCRIPAFRNYTSASSSVSIPNWRILR
jgi:hypothetical protein